MTTTPTPTPTDDAEARGFPAGTFGRVLHIDMAGCDPAVIRDPLALAEWAGHLVDEIGMEAYGKPILQRFGEGSVFGNTVIQPHAASTVIVRPNTTIIQLITTSNIIVHANDDDNTAYVDVFSCRNFNLDAAVAFTVRAFGARAYDTFDRLRRAPKLED